MDFKPRKFKSTNGYEIFVGRNSRENNYLTLKIAEPEDLFLHASDFAGSHVILKTDSPQHADILDAAYLAAYFSKGKEKKAVKVDYTPKKYVTKPRKAPAGLVELEKFKTIKVKMDEKRLPI